MISSYAVELSRKVKRIADAASDLLESKRTNTLGTHAVLYRTLLLIRTAALACRLPIRLPGMVVASSAARARLSKQRHLSSDKDRT